MLSPLNPNTPKPQPGVAHTAKLGGAKESLRLLKVYNVLQALSGAMVRAAAAAATAMVVAIFLPCPTL